MLHILLSLGNGAADSFQRTMIFSAEELRSTTGDFVSDQNVLMYFLDDTHKTSSYLITYDWSSSPFFKKCVNFSKIMNVDSEVLIRVFSDMFPYLVNFFWLLK